MSNEVSCVNCAFSSQFCADVLICGKFEWEINEPAESAINCPNYTPKAIKFRVGKPEIQEFQA